MYIFLTYKKKVGTQSMVFLQVIYYNITHIISSFFATKMTLIIAIGTTVSLPNINLSPSAYN